MNLQLKNERKKIKRKFIERFRVKKRIGLQSYRLELPNEWKVHDVLRISLLNHFCADKFQEVPSIDESTMSLEEINKPYCEVEKILRWRKRKINNKYIKQFFIFWTGYQLEDASWEPENSFFNQDHLYEDLEVKLIPEDK